MGVQFPSFLRTLLFWHREDDILQRDRRSTWYRADSKLQGKGVVFLAVAEKDYIPLVHRPNLSVKDVLVEAAKEARISPISLDFFTLVTEDNRYFLNPQHLITESECKQKYFFKLCFKACCASELNDIDPQAFNYYFHQCRRDFLDGLLGDFREGEESFKKYFTLIILEVIWRARESNVSVHKVIQNPKTYDIHKLYQRSFLAAYRDKEVKAALKQKVELFKELKDDRFKFEYLHALESSPDFFVHHLTVQKHYYCSRPDSPTSSVVEWEILISKEFGIKKRRVDKDSDCPEDVLKEFKDVGAIKVDPTNRHKIIIERNDASPEVLITKSQEDAECLITLIEGYYRLMVNQYVMLTATTALNKSRPKYHGPIERKRAEAILQSKGAEDGLYLIRKKRSDHDAMVLSLCYDGKLKHYNIEKDKEGRFVMGSSKAFKDLPSLIEHYTQKEDGKLPVSLKKNTPPSLEGYSALLDHQPITPTTERPAKLTAFENIPQIPEYLLKEQTTIGQGEFGTVKKAAHIDEESHESSAVILRAVEKGAKAFQEKLYKIAEDLMMLKNSNIAPLLGICVTHKAFYLVSEYLTDGPLDSYIMKMSVQNDGIKRSKVFLFGAQIAEGMMYLHGQDCVHGRLCAHNVLVGQNGDHVKLTDVGLWKMRLEGAKFCEEDPNKVGYNWWAPESLQNGLLTKKSDVWAFGLTLYEIFAMRKPFGSLSKDEIIGKYLRGEYLDPSSPNCPQSVEDIIRKCCNPLEEERRMFREIVRDFMSARLKNESELDKPMIYLEEDEDVTTELANGADIALEPVNESEGEDYSRIASSVHPPEQEPFCPLGERRLQLDASDGHSDIPRDNLATTDFPNKRNKKLIPRAHSFPGARNGKMYSKSPNNHEVSDTRELEVFRKPSVCRTPSWPATTKHPCEHEWKLTDSSEMQEIQVKNPSPASSSSSNGYVDLKDTPQFNLSNITNETPFKPEIDSERYVDTDVLQKKRDLDHVGKKLDVGLESLAVPSETQLVNVSKDPQSLQCGIERVQHVQSDSKEFHTDSNTDSDSEEEFSVSSQSEISFTSDDNEQNQIDNQGKTFQSSEKDTRTFAGKNLQFGKNIVSGFDVGGFLAQDNVQTAVGNPFLTKDQTSHCNSMGDSSSSALASNIVSGFDLSGFLNQVTARPTPANPTLTNNQTNRNSVEDISNSAMASLAQLSLKLFDDGTKGENAKDGDSLKMKTTIGFQGDSRRTDFSSAQLSKPLIPSMTADEHLSMLWKQHSERAKTDVTRSSSLPRSSQSSAVVRQNSQTTSEYYNQPLTKGSQSLSDTQASHISNQGNNSPSVAQQILRDYQVYSNKETSLTNKISESRQNVTNNKDSFQCISALSNKFSQIRGKEMVTDNLALKREQQRKNAELSTFSLEGWGISGQFTKPEQSKPVESPQLSVNSKKVEGKSSGAFSGEKNFSFTGLNLSAWGLSEPTEEKIQPASNPKTRVASTPLSSYVDVPKSTSDKPNQQQPAANTISLEFNEFSPAILPEIREPLPYGVSETCDDQHMPSNTPESYLTRPLASSFPKSSQLTSLCYNSRQSKQVESLPDLKSNRNHKTQHANNLGFTTSDPYVDSSPVIGVPDRASVTGSSAATSRVPTGRSTPISMPSSSVSDARKKKTRPTDKIVDKDTSSVPSKGSTDCALQAQVKTLLSSEASKTPPSDMIEMTQLSGSPDPCRTVSFKEGHMSSSNQNASSRQNSLSSTRNSETESTEKVVTNFQQQVKPEKPDDPKSVVDLESCPSLNPRPLPGIPSSPTKKAAASSGKIETIEENKQLIVDTAEASKKDDGDVVAESIESSRDDSSFTGGYKGPPVRSLSHQTIGSIVTGVEPQKRRQTISGMCLDKSKIPEHLNVNFEDLEMGNKIGEGNFGEVRQAVLKTRVAQVSIKKENVAVKLLKNTAKQRDQEDFVKEAENMLHLSKVKDHQYIIMLRGVCFNPHTNVMMLITELAPRGSLLQYIKNKDNEKLLGVSRLLDFALQIAKGMACLEQQPLVHRDLAARNILVVREDMVKISDFGLSRMMDYYKVNEGKWPRKWYAPESLEYGRFRSKSDVWSYGVTIWEMFSMGLPPYPGISPTEILDYIKHDGRLPRPEDCPQSIYNIMKLCWKYEPMERPTFYFLSEEILPDLQHTCAV